MSYLPTTSGRSNMSLQLLTKGGLLATYYKKTSLTEPLLGSESNRHDGTYHLPNW
jgi:hypothetical protein